MNPATVFIMFAMASLGLSAPFYGPSNKVIDSYDDQSQNINVDNKYDGYRPTYGYGAPHPIPRPPIYGGYHGGYGGGGYGGYGSGGYGGYGGGGYGGYNAGGYGAYDRDNNFNRTLFTITILKFLK